MSELPDGWEFISLGTLIELNPKTNDVEDRTEVGFVPMTLLGKSWLDVPGFELRQWASVKKGYTHFRDGDVLLAKITPCFENGKAGLLNGLPNGIGSGSTEYFVCRTSPDTLDARYLLGYLKTDDFVHTGAMSMTGSVGHKRVPKEYLLGRQIPLPPRNEQTRIANQLDILLARVQACNDRFDAIPALLKRFRQTVLDAATNGVLTQDWRDAQNKTAPAAHEPAWAKAKALHALPAGWRWAKFTEFLSGFRSGTSAVPGGDPSVYPVLRSSSVRPMEIDFEDVRYLPNMTKVRADDLLVEGDVLFTRLSGSLEYVANCAVVRGLGDRKIYYPDRLFRAKLIRPEQGTYFELCFASPLLRKHLTVEAKSTAGHQRISMGAVTDFPIPRPPDDEQQEIIKQVGVLLRFADRIEARCTAARAQAQRLTPLVLAKAFRGELVPQDPNDEPASALLARIGSSYTTAAGENKRKVPVAPKECAQTAINL
ncbi:MAG: restriction endonuclease subunit S [Rhodoferax sp.]|nr:restriction endonuclease subunit S [Rhodoferax sp.]